MGETEKKVKYYLDFSITPQPDLATCGAASLHAVYRYYGDNIPLARLIAEVQQFPGGGTLAVWLALHAMRRGYKATIYTCNLQLFDPTWFHPGSPRLADRLSAQMAIKKDPKLQAASVAYLEFLKQGGELLMEDVTSRLISGILHQGLPLIGGLSATWLYRCARERPEDMISDDLAGEAAGHFVVVHGLDPDTREVNIADPYLHFPLPGSHSYTVGVDRLIGAILLGILTYDAKLLIVRPPSKAERVR